MVPGLSGAAEALVAGRVAAEALMVDACVVDRPGPSVMDPLTGKVKPSYTLVYPHPDHEAPLDGRCKVQQTLAQSSSPEAGGAVFTVQNARLDLPVGAGPVAVGDRVRLVSAASNPDLVGNVYRVKELFEKSWQTAQRVRVEELV